ncbi:MULTISPECIES: septal ring lytic transglycosylase RlpA family protein [unclassified Halomonas]|uniref:septal ring lytic transglycosylase RlpA family protein n=1 Tax=unclassified Halomonas TaxID=2609666 RepID=UPI001F0525C3|nr:MULTISPECIES: septal ring lytic transglycosylase RlpA family protein [unclassified Halomonas]
MACPGHGGEFMTLRAPLLPTLSLLVALTGCAGGGGTAPETTQQAAATPQDSRATAGGRYAMSGDAYPETPPDVSQVPDAVPRDEPRSRAGNRSTYEVWGKTYHVLDDPSGYQREGTASWYGQKFHGYATSNGEIYDMYKMTAAHKSLPLPTFARVTNLDNGRSVIVRVNDRGPFHDDREIDLSYAAAARLDILDHGTGRVRVSVIDPDQWQASRGAGASSDSVSGGVRAAPVSAAASTGTRTTASTTASTTARAAPNAAPSAPSAASPAAGQSAPQAPAAGTPGIYIQVAALGSADSAQDLKADLETRLNQQVRVASAAGLHKVQVGPLASRGQAEPVRERLRQAGFAQTFVVDAR